MEILENRFRGDGLPPGVLDGVPLPGDDASGVLAMLARCPVHAPSPLVAAPDLARLAGVGEVLVKDERARMGLGSFKALGAAHVIARDAAAGRAAGTTYVTASAGNHGLSVAAGAAVFGAGSVVYISEEVPAGFATRLAEQGARVIRQGATYEASMEAAAAAAGREGWVLLSDSSWPGYFERPHVLMEGYLALMHEVGERLPEPPDQIILQAGVGGLAGACAAFARRFWGQGPVIAVVEPEWAPALAGSIRAGRPVTAPGPVSCMGRLDCKDPSLIALAGLARDADLFVTITEAEAIEGTGRCADAGLATTPSGAAGIAALLAAPSGWPGLGPDARVLTFLSEAS